MTAVQTQTSPPSQTSEVMPAGQAPAVSAAPANNTPTPNPTNSGASTETQPGAGGGVDLEKLDANSYEALIEQMKADDFDDDDDAVTDPPQGVTTPANPPAAPAPAAPAATPAAEATPGAGDDEPMQPPGHIPNGLKVPTKDDPLAFHTLRLYKDSRLSGGKLSFTDAEGMARKLLGLPEPAAPSAPAEPAPAQEPAAPAAAASTTGKRSEELVKQLEALESEFEQAASGLDSAEQGRLMRQMNKLNREIAQAEAEEVRQEAQESVQQVEAERQFLATWESNRERAYGMFAHADAANPASALHQKAVEIKERYESSTDAGQQAISQSADSVLWFFNLAAQELGVMPGAVPAAAAPVAPAQSVQPPAKSTPSSTPPQRPVGAALISGSPSGTTQQPAAAGQDYVNRINEVHTLEAVIAALPRGA